MALSTIRGVSFCTPNLPEYGLVFEENDECVVHAGVFPLSMKSKCRCRWATACSQPFPWLCSWMELSSGCLLG